MTSLGPRDRITPQERAAIDAALASGRVSRPAAGLACGLSTIESVVGSRALADAGRMLTEAKRGAANSAHRSALQQKAMA